MRRVKSSVVCSERNPGGALGALQALMAVGYYDTTKNA